MSDSEEEEEEEEEDREEDEKEGKQNTWNEHVKTSEDARWTIIEISLVEILSMLMAHHLRTNSMPDRVC